MAGGERIFSGLKSVNDALDAIYSDEPTIVYETAATTATTDSSTWLLAGGIAAAVLVVLVILIVAMK